MIIDILLMIALSIAAIAWIVLLFKIAKTENYPEVYSYDIRMIANCYGYEEQSRMLQEECAELIQAINKWHRKPSAKSLDNIAEEIADVRIMCEQVTYLLGLGRSVEVYKREKILRQMDRLGKVEKKNGERQECAEEALD